MVPSSPRYRRREVGGISRGGPHGICARRFAVARSTSLPQRQANWHVPHINYNGEGTPRLGPAGPPLAAAAPDFYAFMQTARAAPQLGWMPMAVVDAITIRFRRAQPADNQWRGSRLSQSLGVGSFTRPPSAARPRPSCACASRRPRSRCAPCARKCREPSSLPCR